MIQRRNDYFTSVRMTLVRTTGNEAGNGRGAKNIHTGDNVNYIMTHGGEYAGLFYESEYWDWNKIPGTTVEQTPVSVALQKPSWGELATGGNAFAGIVSDEKNGAAGVIFDNHNITAKKSWFFFDDFFVALGRDIKAPSTTYDITTTLNQVNLNGDVITFEKNNQSGIYHDAIGYLIANNAENNIEISRDNDIFKLGINHGKSPNAAQYQYLVYPNISVTDFESKSAQSPVTIVNKAQYQAVYKNDLSIVYVISYDAANITLANGTTIKTHGPIALMIKQLSTPVMEVLVANPTAESIKAATTTVEINGESYNVKFPQDFYAGKTINAVNINL